MSSDIAKLFAECRWDEIAAQIDTGTDNPDSSRALIVFNPTSYTISGIALFHVDMSWKEGRELPPILVSRLSGKHPLSSSITEPHITHDEDRQIGTRIKFSILIHVDDVPANGWDTYIAEYVDEPQRTKHSARGIVTELIVVETTRHTGTLLPKYP